MRRVIAALVVVGLVVAVILLWPSPTAEIPPDTLAGATTTTTSTSLTTTTTSSQTTTSTVGEDSHVVETVEEAEEILKHHYYRWFRGIHDEDESLIRSTVILESQVEAALAQFGVMEFNEPPTPEGLHVEQIDLLRSDEECLAVFAQLSADFREGSTQGVVVFRFAESSWKFLSSWQLRGDMWEADCESTL